MDKVTWFEATALDNFRMAFQDVAGKPNLRFLQLGVFEGDASIWLMQNVLTHPSSVLYDVDSWDGGDNPHTLGNVDWRDVEGYYDQRTEKYRQREDVTKSGLLVKVKDSVWPWLLRACGSQAWTSLDERSGFDFIYIDAGHTTIDTIEAAVLSYRLLKPNGLLCFDDYMWKTHEGLLTEPTMAIDMFKYMYADRMEVLRVDAQCWMRRTEAQERH